MMETPKPVKTTPYRPYGNLGLGLGLKKVEVGVGVGVKKIRVCRTLSYMNKSTKRQKVKKYLSDSLSDCQREHLIQQY